MKKLALVLVLVSIIGAGTAFAQFGIGVHGGYGGLGGGAGVNIAFSNIFIYVDAIGIGGNSMNLSGAVDFIQFLGGNIGSGLSWYWRIGIAAGIWGFDDTLGFAVAARAPIGLSWKPIPLIEIFLQAQPQIGLQILPDIDLWANFWGGNVGIRFWL